MTDPHVQGYADRIFDAARRDGYPVKPKAGEASLLASAYGVDIEEPAPTLRGVTYQIAERITR